MGRRNWELKNETEVLLDASVSSAGLYNVLYNKNICFIKRFSMTPRRT